VSSCEIAGEFLRMLALIENPGISSDDVKTNFIFVTIRAFRVEKLTSLESKGTQTY